MRCISRFGMIALATTIVVSAPISMLSPAISQPKPQSETTIRPDLLLLFKAADQALNVSAFQTESLTEIKGDSSGMIANIQFQTNTIVQAPNRFRSEIRFGNQPKPRFTFISDGKTVSLYRSDLNEYTTMSYQEFNRRNDTFLIGMSSILYMTMYPGMKEANAQGGFTNPVAQRQLSAMIPVDVKGKPEKANGQELMVYEYADRQRGFNYGMAVNPVDALIKQIRLTGDARGFNLLMTETIQRRVVNPKVSASAFQFTPPQGAKRVRTIDTSPGAQ